MTDKSEEQNTLLDTLQSKKEELRKLILAHEAPGINGVALCKKRAKLLVFYMDEAAATQFLQEMLGETLMNHTETFSGRASQRQLQPQKRSIVERISSFLENLQQVIPLRPGRRIKAKKEGMAGCFLRFNEPKDPLKIGVLTAEHLFENNTPTSGPRDVEVQDNDERFQYAGWSWLFASKQGDPSIADCAIFKPDMTILKLKEGVNKMTDDYVKKDDLIKTEGYSTHNQVDDCKGEVCDSSATIMYVQDDGTAITLDRQILIAGQDFGLGGYSGSPVLMAQAAQGKFNEGDVLGIFVYVCENEFYHFLTPLHACLDTFKDAKGIYIP